MGKGHGHGQGQGRGSGVPAALWVKPLLWPAPPRPHPQGTEEGHLEAVPFLSSQTRCN